MATVEQAEGGEQGDPLMPLLYCLGAKRALAAASERLQDGELLFACLDDVYALCKPARARAVYDILAEELERACNIKLHEGKTRMWNTAGVKPEDIDPLGPDVWSPGGIKVLGTPVGGVEFVSGARGEAHA